MDLDDARRANQRKQKCTTCCQECFGDVWLGSGYLPHDPNCRRGQDAEAAALRYLRSPIPVHEDPHEEGEEYLPRTVFPGISEWEQDEYDIGP